MSGRQNTVRRISVLLTFSLVLLYATAFWRLLSAGQPSGQTSVGIPVRDAGILSEFLDSREIAYLSIENVELQFDHYNPERLTVGSLPSRFLPDDDRMTPFLKALPQLFDYSKGEHIYRVFFTEEPLSDDLKQEWRKIHPDIDLVFPVRDAGGGYRLFFYLIGTLCFAVTLIIQREAWRSWGYAVSVFAAAFLSGSSAALWAAGFIVNTFLSLWRQWAPHREYWMMTGVNTVSRRDAVLIAGEATAAVICGLLPALLIPGERVVVLTAVAMGVCGLLGALLAVQYGRRYGRRRYLVFRPLLGSTFRRPWKTAVAELILGGILFCLPVGFTVTAFLSHGERIPRDENFWLPSSSYGEVYEIAQKQPRGTLNAVGYIEEKVFQYCYRYQKLLRLPEPGTEVFVPEYYYKNGEIHSGKIIAEIFTERGFSSIMEKLKSDPLSVYFLSKQDADGQRVSVAVCLLWGFFTVFYFVLLIPFFRFSARQLRFGKIKEKV